MHLARSEIIILHHCILDHEALSLDGDVEPFDHLRDRCRANATQLAPPSHFHVVPHILHAAETDLAPSPGITELRAQHTRKRKAAHLIPGRASAGFIVGLVFEIWRQRMTLTTHVWFLFRPSARNLYETKTVSS